LLLLAQPPAPAAVTAPVAWAVTQKPKYSSQADAAAAGAWAGASVAAGAGLAGAAVAGGRVAGAGVAPPPHPAATNALNNRAVNKVNRRFIGPLSWLDDRDGRRFDHCDGQRQAVDGHFSHILHLWGMIAFIT